MTFLLMTANSKYENEHDHDHDHDHERLSKSWLAEIYESMTHFLLDLPYYRRVNEAGNCCGLSHDNEISA